MEMFSLITRAFNAMMGGLVTLPPRVPMLVAPPVVAEPAASNQIPSMQAEKKAERRHDGRKRHAAELEVDAKTEAEEKYVELASLVSDHVVEKEDECLALHPKRSHSDCETRPFLHREGGVPFGTVVAPWIEFKKISIKPSTLAAYVNIIYNHLVPYWKDCDIDCITEELAQDFLGYLLKDGHLRKAGGLPVRTAHDIMVVFKGMLRWCARKKMTSVPNWELQWPRDNRPQKLKTFSPEALLKLGRALCSELNPVNAGILLSLGTGMRIGEISALKWNAIDLDEKKLEVRATLQRIYMKRGENRGGISEIHMGSPKTMHSARVIQLSDELVDMLKTLPRPAEPDAFLLTGTRKCMEVRTLRERFVSFLDRHGIPRLNFHALRHSFATRCVSSGADVKTVSELLGHANVNITMNLYVHPDEASRRKVMNNMQLGLLGD